MISAIETQAACAIGVVEYASAGEIRVALDLEAPHATALNTGTPSGFPRLNGYVIIPGQAGATVGIIASVYVQHQPYPKRLGLKDFGLIDLPFPGRGLTILPVATLLNTGSLAESRWSVRRGVDVFPTVGDPVVLPSTEQLRAIVEGESSGRHRRVKVGTSPIAGGAPVFVDPDRLFGRHLAVLGNTGSGKSCSVAGLVQWSLASASEQRSRAGTSGPANARFIILDPNGEYSAAFESSSMRVFRVAPETGESLKVPAWLWNGDEWAAFTSAQPGVQRPLLMEALRRLRNGESLDPPAERRLKTTVRTYLSRFATLLSSGGFLGFGGRKDTVSALLNMQDDFAQYTSAGVVREDLRSAAEELVQLAVKTEDAAFERNNRYVKNDQRYYADFKEVEVRAIVDRLTAVAQALGVTGTTGAAEDTPVFFDVDHLPMFVEGLAAGASGRDLNQFVDTLTLRIRSLLSRERLSAIAHPDKSPTLGEWLEDYIGAGEAGADSVCIIDLSLVPSDVVHVVVAVLGRMIFEALQRIRRMYGDTLPTTLILEEAHNFVHREYLTENSPAAARLCARTFERIAREGRKFGLGLVISSQRPSELSATVLSQCNTFLLHRIVNDNDQSLVRRFVPEGLAEMLAELPSLPARRAILLGWAAAAPILVEVTNLPEGRRPHSPDPDFWAVWTGERKPSVVWGDVAKLWQGVATAGGSKPE